MSPTYKSVLIRKLFQLNMSANQCLIIAFLLVVFTAIISAGPIFVEEDSQGNIDTTLNKSANIGYNIFTHFYETSITSFNPSFIADVSCPQNEVYMECGTACPATCSNPRPGRCHLSCINACFCRKNFLRLPNGKCVRSRECLNWCFSDYETIMCTLRSGIN